MSDDTPTQRFDTAGEAPTERFTAAAPSEEVVEERKSRRLITILAIVGGALLVAVLVVLILLLTKGPGTPAALPTGSATPTASASPSPTPSVSATPTPSPTPTPSTTPAPQPPEDTGPAFAQFDVKQSQDGCSMGGPGFDPTYPVVQVHWKAVRSDEAWIVSGTSDAVDSQFMQIPLNGDQNDFQYPITLDCSPSSTFTITLLGSNGDHLSKTWTVQNTGDKF